MKLGKEYILEIMAMFQFRNCYQPVYVPKRWRSGYTK